MRFTIVMDAQYHGELGEGAFWQFETTGTATMSYLISYLFHFIRVPTAMRRLTGDHLQETVIYTFYCKCYSSFDEISSLLT
jgi:hypothetical protein